MDVVLTVVEGPRAGLVYRATGKSAITVGRSKSADFHILDGAMSRVHAVIARDEGGWYVEDRKSLNGLWRGTQRVEKLRLNDGQVFHLGKFTAVRFHLVEARSRTTDGAAAPPCAKCGKPIAAAADVVRGADGRPCHAACGGLDHLIGQDLGGFKVTEAMSPLGEAFFFRAHQPTLNRTVVLEVFDAPKTARPGFRDALLDEVRRASRFLHPHVLQIFDFGEARDLCFVAMELFPGEPLAKVLEERRFVKIRGAIEVAAQLADALAYAREQGWARPWISPASVLVSPDHQVKAKLFTEPMSGADVVRAKDAAYVAPEVLLGTSKGQEQSAAVYSIGAMLYHMLAGIPPFEADSPAEYAHRAQKESPPALRRINLKVAPALASLVESSLDRRPEARPDSLVEFASMLRKASAPALR